MDSRWRNDEVQGASELDLLVYRSRLLGTTPNLVNFGGGNTSGKTVIPDFRGHPTPALLVKASGVDLATCEGADFSPLRLDDVVALGERDEVTDSDMVDYLRHALINQQAKRPSIETLLHALLPFPHIDHTHATVALAFCAAEHGKELVEQIFGERAVWVPYVRPGFQLGKLARTALQERPRAEAMFLEKHGLVTWGNTSQECYERTRATISTLEEAVATAVRKRDPFGSSPDNRLPPEHTRARWLALLPVLRGALGSRHHVILQRDDSESVTAFLASPTARDLAKRGVATPDYVLYTGIRPLWVDGAATVAEQELPGLIHISVKAYEQDYEAAFQRYCSASTTMLDPAPRVVLLPGLGMVAAGTDVITAASALENFCQTIAVMRGAEALDRYATLHPEQAYEIEYWPLERDKLKQRRPADELSGRVAVITGGASGIGRATAHRLAQAGAHLVVLDINVDGSHAVAEAIDSRNGHGRAIGLLCDVTSEQSTACAFEEAILRYGGADIVVANAGLAASHSIEETSLAEWQHLHDVMTTGYFLTARTAFRIFRQQGTGGNLVVMSSKNGLSAAKNVLAYATAKAAELQMTRCLAEEGGSAGIRVNAVAPDAVFRGSTIWNPQWREERSRSHGVPLEQLEDYYRLRSVLKVNIFPEDVAEAVLFLCSDRSAKTTGCTITVDGGVTTAYPR
ncbi:MAG: bifunctional rhamnulose-1-phosphate aldolase/short-chain dehydrogenase [Chloroflexi bacterium]|nr:bifunctional rhamnulose-1-phosphate aldolase/short-chain dehydrogenase [Chloroflexota bacterium]